MEAVEVLMGLFRTTLGSLPAQIAGHDLQGRRKIEDICNSELDKIASEARKRSAEIGAVDVVENENDDDDAAA